MKATGQQRVPVVISGPTASGKSALALALANRIGGEIVCADSRQVYAGLTIASAAPSAAELVSVPHHGFGSQPPDVPMNAALFSSFADQVVAEVLSRDRTPIVVGGTGMWLRAWRNGLDDKGADKDMNAMLARPPRFLAHWLLVDAPIDVLTGRIEARARHMFGQGIDVEATALRKRLPADHVLLATLGIAEALEMVDGQLPIDDAARRTAQRTRQYARRQRTWFKKEPWWTRLWGGPQQLLADTLSLVDQRR
jgi:tRNA dimethylallyltransferase